MADTEMNLKAATGSLRLGEKTAGDTLIVTILDPRLEARNSFAFKKHLQERLAANRRVVIDLSGVDFVDSSGLGAMIGALKAAPSREALVVVRPAPKARGVFTVTRTESLFAWAETLAEALPAKA